MTHTENLKVQLTALPPEDRDEILDFLRGLCEQHDVDPAWNAELERRTNEYRRDPSVGIPGEQAFAELRKKYS